MKLVPMIIIVCSLDSLSFFFLSFSMIDGLPSVSSVIEQIILLLSRIPDEEISEKEERNIPSTGHTFLTRFKSRGGFESRLRP